MPNDDDVTIEGVITDKMGTPRNDGARGSGLYAVPIRLSRSLSGDEARLLEHLWDGPPEFTTMHRPGIARVSGDVITLDGTTIDEVERYHAHTLSLVVGTFNMQLAQLRSAQAQQRANDVAETEVHRQHVADVADRVRFDRS